MVAIQHHGCYQKDHPKWTPQLGWQETAIGCFKDEFWGLCDPTSVGQCTSKSNEVCKGVKTKPQKIKLSLFGLVFCHQSAW
jgi:hypothetical protein